MPRAPRIEFGGAIYHVMNRGDHLEAIFRDDRDRRRFLETLGEGCESAGWVIHSFVFMPNHYHLLLETPRPTLVKGMQWLNATYTQRFNSRHRTCGHLFQGRYKALLVDDQSPGYLLTVSDYIHLNPIRARLTPTAEELLRYPWCSAGWLAGRRRGRPDWLRSERLYGELGFDPRHARAQRNYRDYLTRRVGEVDGLTERWKPIRRGWCFGSESFTTRMRDTVAELMTAERRPESWSGAAVAEVEEQRATRLLQRAVKALGYSAAAEVRGVERYLVARLLRCNTKVPVGWLTEQFGLQTCGGMRYGLYNVGRQLASDKTLQRTWRTLNSL
jgi:REP-associated tyrosine transposase